MSGSKGSWYVRRYVPCVSMYLRQTRMVIDTSVQAHLIQGKLGLHLLLSKKLIL